MFRLYRVAMPVLSATVFWLLAAAWAMADSHQSSPAPAPAEGGNMQYMLSYFVVVLGIVLGLLVVARASNRRDRERPAGYVEKNIMGEK